MLNGAILRDCLLAFMLIEFNVSIAGQNVPCVNKPLNSLEANSIIIIIHIKLLFGQAKQRKLPNIIMTYFVRTFACDF